MLVAMFKITHSKPIPRRLRARFVLFIYLFYILFWGGGGYSGIGISQTIVRSRATLIPEWLQNFHSDTVNWF